VNIFLDTANVESIAKAAKSGIVGGVTTNPSILAKERRSFKESIDLICKTLPDGELLFEVMAIDKKGMIKEARKLATLSKQVVVKIPMTPEGIAAVSQLSKEGISCAVTLVFTASQAITATCAGAKYVAPFVGRLDDMGADGVELVAKIKKIFAMQNRDTKILAASIRNVSTVEHLFSVGCDIVTMPIDIFEALFNHSLTDSGLQKFIEDSKKVSSSALL
jgi:transaldolase